MLDNMIVLERGTQIGMLYKEFFTDFRKQKKIRLRGYIFFGIINNNAVGLEIMAYEEENRNLSWMEKEEQKPFYRVKRKKKSTGRWVNIGFLVKEERRGKSGKFYHYLYGKIFIEGVEIRIRAFPCFDNTFSIEFKNRKKNKKPDYRIELASVIKCGIIELD